MKLKICGITNLKDLQLCIKYADVVGFIVEYPKSPRSISIEKAKKLMDAVPPFVSSVIVVPDFKKAMRIYTKLKPTIIQLHGSETIEDVKTFCKKVNCKIIKACGYENALAFSKYVDAVLIDDKYSKIDLDKLNDIIQKSDKPIILAGHLTPENILDVLEKVNPYCIDVASGVEKSPCKKDLGKVKQFKKKLDLGKTVGSIIKNKPITPNFKLYDKLSKKENLKLITEIKPASPSEGKLLDAAQNLEEIVRSMDQGGASALSVLVEKEKFNGNIDLLKKVRNLTCLPILAKGFFFNTRQIAEVAVAGADAFLLMIRVVEAQGQNVKELIDFGAALGLDVVVEANTTEEIYKAINLGAKIIEINNRDIYGDLEIDFNQAALGKALPDGIIFISASGVKTIEDIRRIYKSSQSRVDAFLIGTSIMRSCDIRLKIQQLLNEGNKVIT